MNEEDPPTPRLSQTYLSFQSTAELLALRLNELAHGIETRLPLVRGGEHFRWKDTLLRVQGIARELDGLAARFARWPELHRVNPAQVTAEKNSLLRRRSCRKLGKTQGVNPMSDLFNKFVAALPGLVEWAGHVNRGEDGIEALSGHLCSRRCWHYSGKGTRLDKEIEAKEDRRRADGWRQRDDGQWVKL